MDTVELPNGKVLERKVFSEYTKEELEECIKYSKKYHEVLELLKVHKIYHSAIVKFVQENSIDISHFTTTAKPKRTMQEILVKDSYATSSYGIKKYLIRPMNIKNGQ